MNRRAIAWSLLFAVGLGRAPAYGDMAGMDHGHGGGGHGSPIGSVGTDAPPPPKGDLLPQDQLEQALTSEHPRGPHAPEPYLLPYSAGQVQQIDKTFGNRAFEATHRQTHSLIDAYKQEKSLTPDQLKQGISDILGGVRRVVDTGLEYAGIKDSPLPEDQKQAKLAEIKQRMEQAGAGLTQIPMGSQPGQNAHVALMAGDGKSGVMQIMGTVEGQQHIDSTIQSAPANPTLQIAAGNNALANNDPNAAKNYFNNALSLDPGNADALTGRGAANMDLKNFKDAAQDARDALAINPDDPAAKAILGLAHDTVGEGTRIMKERDFGAGGQDPGGAAAGGGLGLAQGSLKYLAPSNGSGLQSSAYTREAMRSLALGDSEAALRAAGRAASLDPKNADAYGLRAFANTQAGHFDDALKDAMAALALDPSNTMAHNARAKAYNKMGMYHEALAAADDALRADPRNAYAHYMRAMALNGMGDRKGMLNALAQAASLDPRFKDAYDLAAAAPAEKDMAFLFPEDQLASARASLAAQAAAGPKRFWGLTLPTIVGAALVLFGLMHVALSGMFSRLRGSYAAAVRTGPTLGATQTMVSLPTPPPLSLGGRAPPAGTVLRGQYRRLGQIGSSVHGAVYEGHDVALDRRVAIRKLRADMRAADRERLMAPARVAAGLSHAGIAPVYAVFEEGESLYLVSEWAAGRSLRDWLAARGPLAWDEALPLFRQVAAALDYAHGKGAVHGAIKASNLMISAEGRPKIIDFGLSRGPAEKAGDLVSLSACLRESIAGLSPARLDAVDAALARAHGEFASAAQVVETVEASLASTL